MVIVETVIVRVIVIVVPVAHPAAQREGRHHRGIGDHCRHAEGGSGACGGEQGRSHVLLKWGYFG
jgi:hypothetical protein